MSKFINFTLLIVFFNVNTIKADIAFVDSPSSSADWVYFTSGPSSSADWIYLTNNCSYADAEVVSGSPSYADWIYFTSGPSSSAEWIYLSNTSSSADFTICFPKGFSYTNEHIAAIYILKLKKK